MSGNDNRVHGRPSTTTVCIYTRRARPPSSRKLRPKVPTSYTAVTRPCLLYAALATHGPSVALGTSERAGHAHWATKRQSGAIRHPNFWVGQGAETYGH